ncbi:hypothetical protein B0H12DRAFT_1244925 [Mycena haematopus]|nr:hypothetical protein B0H12DRAFT_1244925 [Mycena haematopus]
MAVHFNFTSTVNELEDIEKRGLARFGAILTRLGQDALVASKEKYSVSARAVNRPSGAWSWDVLEANSDLQGVQYVRGEPKCAFRAKKHRAPSASSSSKHRFANYGCGSAVRALEGRRIAVLQLVYRAFAPTPPAPDTE